MSEIKLLVTEKQISSLISSTKEYLPYESCSLLLGNIVDWEYRVSVLKNMDNIANSEYSFIMDPDQLIKVYQWASNKELEVIGVYHSHLDGVRPSSTDVIFMQINSLIWLIYEVSSSKFKAFILENDTLKEVKIKISKD
ncbi:MAG TPA: M67 family metallopeptidase [Nitrososphaeraceae archaeon]|jgi:proteasome lid subunit RPN8/RPN11